MNFKLRIAAAAMLAVCVVASYGQTSATKAPVKKHVATAKTKAPAPPTVQEQIQSLRQELEGQINSLKSDLAAKDAQLQRAQQTAAEAQAAADRAQAAATAQQQAVTDNAAAVTTLQSSVTDLKGNQASLATTVSDETTKFKKEIANPSALRYKGINITPGGFMAAESVYRQKATGADIPTALTAIPFNGASSAQLSEFFGSGRQSRVSLLAEGKTPSATYRGYMEADFLGVGTSSNNNQSNSYVMRQRVVWADATLNSGLSFQGGQMWSLTAERAKGLSNLSGDVKTPLTIDPNYVPGFVWTRQYGFRVVETMKHVAFGVSLENPQTITGGSGCTQGTVTCLYGASTSAQSSSYNAVNATYSYNLGPDIIAKVAVDPGWGHYEAFAIGRFPHYQLWPSTSAPTVSQTNSLATGGFGGSLRAPVFGKYGDFGLSGLYGYGVGRYGDTTLADVTFDYTGTMLAIQNTSALSTIELKPTPRLVIYGNFGEDFAGRLISTNGGTASGYGLLNANNSGCNTVVLPTSSTVSTSPANCNGVNKFVQEFVGGFWYDFYKGPAGRVRYGVQYGHLNRAIWGGSTTPQVDATENQFYTSFRYYLP
jgi:type II secretory pathway pseudopilin PulG